jgi:DNA-nicking Smr family endonuclease
LAALERRQARRLRSGQVEIEARLDLHGMRQSDAHAALRRFLLACHARGVRWALVITGKGATARGGASGEHERGVLRRNVPRWLAEPELRAIVISYTAAAAPHGGEGALYVQLRRRRGEG